MTNQSVGLSFQKACPECNADIALSNVQGIDVCVECGWTRSE